MLDNVVVEQPNSCFGSKHSFLSFGPFFEVPRESVVLFPSVEEAVSCMGRMRPLCLTHLPPRLSPHSEEEEEELSSKS